MGRGEEGGSNELTYRKGCSDNDSKDEREEATQTNPVCMERWVGGKGQSIPCVSLLFYSPIRQPIYSPSTHSSTPPPTHPPTLLYVLGCSWVVGLVAKRRGEEEEGHGGEGDGVGVAHVGDRAFDRLRVVVPVVRDTVHNELSGGLGFAEAAGEERLFFGCCLSKLSRERK